MPMLTGHVVDRPSTTIINTRKSIRYVLHPLSVEYRADVKNSRYGKRVCIGKMLPDSDTRMTPNENYVIYYPDLYNQSLELPPPPPFSATVHVGSAVLIRKLAKKIGLTDILIDIYEEENANNILDVLSYLIIEESSVFQHYPTFARETMINSNRIMTDTEVGKLCDQLIDADTIVKFKKQWNDKFSSTTDDGENSSDIEIETIYVSIDSTNFNTEAKAIDIAEFGAAKDDKTKPQINMQVSMKGDDNTPLNYELYSGSINDMSECDRMVEQMHEYGYRDVGIMADRGYFTKDVILYIDDKEYPMIMMANESTTFIRQLILKYGAELRNNRELCLLQSGLYAKTVDEMYYGKKRWFHIYYDSVRAAKYIQTFDMKIRNLEAALNALKGTVLRKNANLAPFTKWFVLDIDKKTNVLNGYSEKPLSKKEPNVSLIQDVRRRYGFFVIMTTEEMTAEEALYKYRGRDNIEKFFRSIKTDMDFSTPRVYEDKSVAGKIHLIFLGSIIRNSVYQLSRKLKAETNNTKDYTVPGILNIMRSCEATVTPKDISVYKRNYGLTAKQKKILGYVDTDTEEVDKEIAKFRPKQ